MSKRAPKWIKPGILVDYHAVINEPATKLGCRVLAGPALLGGHTLVVWLEGVRGCVAVAACTPAARRSESGGEGAPHYDAAGRLKHYCTRDDCPDIGEGSMRPTVQR